jgi:AmmeMemoRadiSam system protein B
VGILASVDLAHIGPRYGDNYIPNAGSVRDNIESDAALLELLEKCCVDDFINRINRDGNSRKICGVAPLYTLVKALESRAEGATLCHSHATVDDKNSFVTFASMAFYERNSASDPNTAHSK